MLEPAGQLADRPGTGTREAPPLVGFDIETDTSRGGLDPRTSSVVATALAAGGGDEVILGDEREILVRTDQRIAELGTALLVTWNGSGFDLPFLEHRARILEVELGLSTTEDPRRLSHREPGRRAVRARWHRMVHLDGYQLYRADVGVTLGLSCGLKPLARLVGLTPVELDRAMLHEEDQDSIARYVASDARIASELVRRRMPAALTMADWPMQPADRPLQPADRPAGAGSQLRPRAARD